MRLLRRLLLALWLALVVLASLIPRVPRADAVAWFPGADRVGHAVAYGVLCVLAVWAFGGRGRRVLVMAGLGAVVLGVLLECVQPLTGRTFDLTDMAANAAGAGLGLVGMLLARRIAVGGSAVGD